jgi:hypothetical protein
MSGEQVELKALMLDCLRQKPTPPCLLVDDFCHRLYWRGGEDGGPLALFGLLDHVNASGTWRVVLFVVLVDARFLVIHIGLVPYSVALTESASLWCREAVGDDADQVVGTRLTLPLECALASSQPLPLPLHFPALNLCIDNKTV